MYEFKMPEFSVNMEINKPDRFPKMLLTPTAAGRNFGKNILRNVNSGTRAGPSLSKLSIQRWKAPSGRFRYGYIIRTKNRTEMPWCLFTEAALRWAVTTPMTG